VLIRDYVRAGVPLLAVRTIEPDRLTKVIYDEIEAINDENAEKESVIPSFTTWSWDVVTGLTCKSDPEQNQPDSLITNELIDNVIPGLPDFSVIVLHNFGHFLKGINIIQSLQNALPMLKSSMKTLIFSGADVQLPIEIERNTMLLDHPLPTSDQLRVLVDKYANKYSSIVPEDSLTDERLSAVTEAGLGQTLFELENGIALSIVKNRELSHTEVWNMKTQIVKKNGCLELGDYNKSLDDLKGLENIKDFGQLVMPNPLARGMLLLGVAGAGKSHFAQALGNALGLQTISLDFGRLFGSYVGESEQKTRNALKVVEAMAPCLLYIDEIEKGLSGVQSSGKTDSGVTARVLGTFLTWMNDHTCQTPIIATCNDISKLPTEFLRSERWDSIFFVDLPTKEEGLEILTHYLKVYSLSDTNASTIFNEYKLEKWTGAEIKTLCRLAHIMGNDLDKARNYVVPVSVARKQMINELRTSASKVAVPASKQSSKETKPRKKVVSTRTLSVEPAKEKDATEKGED